MQFVAGKYFSPKRDLVMNVWENNSNRDTLFVFCVPPLSLKDFFFFSFDSSFLSLASYTTALFYC
jgi:hypothetical protein